MNYDKRIESVRRRNAELLQELGDLKQRVDMDSFERKRIENLLEELERISNEWNSIIKELRIRSEQYNSLTDELRGMKSIMLKMGFGLPWHKRLILRIKKFFYKLFHKKDLN